MKKILKFFLILVVIAIILVPTMLYLRQKDGVNTSKEEIMSDIGALKEDVKGSALEWWDNSQLKGIFDGVSQKVGSILPDTEKNK